MNRGAIIIAVLCVFPGAVLPKDGMSKVLEPPSPKACHPIQTFYDEYEEVEGIIDRIIEELSYREMIAELIVTSCGSQGNSFSRVLELIRGGQAGGVMFLGATSSEIREYTRTLTEESRKSGLLLPLYAIDGEPLLLHERITDLKGIPGAGEIRTPEQAREIAFYITAVLRDLGIHINYAPVCDYGFNRAVIGRRSMGTEQESVSALSEIFINTMQANGIVSTVKHFPGHGSVEGDSHIELLFAQGVPLEIPVFRHAIEVGVVSIMVGHLGVKGAGMYDTEGKPSSLSRAMITGVLKESLGFNGIVVSDALNMRAVVSFDIPGVQALRAGCDMVLMPDDEEAVIDEVRYEIGFDEEFKHQIVESAKKVVRLKLLLGLINDKELEKAAQIDDKYR